MSALQKLVTGLECKILLRHVTERYYDYGCHHFGNSGVNMKMLHKKLKEDIIQKNAEHYQQEITEQLNPPPEYGSREHNIPVQKVSQWERNGKGHQEGCNMWADRSGRSKNHLLLKNEVIRNEIEEDIQDSISTPAGGIAEGLDRHQLSEGRVKKIYCSHNQSFHHGRKFMKWVQ